MTTFHCKLNNDRTKPLGNSIYICLNDNCNMDIHLYPKTR